MSVYEIPADSQPPELSALPANKDSRMYPHWDERNVRYINGRHPMVNRIRLVVDPPEEISPETIDQVASLDLVQTSDPADLLLGRINRDLPA